MTTRAKKPSIRVNLRMGESPFLFRVAWPLHLVAVAHAKHLIEELTHRVAPGTPPRTTRSDALLGIGSEWVILLTDAPRRGSALSRGKSSNALSHGFEQVNLPTHAVKRILRGMIGQCEANLLANGREFGIPVAPEVRLGCLHQACANGGEWR